VDGASAGGVESERLFTSRGSALSLAGTLPETSPRQDELEPPPATATRTYQTARRYLFLQKRWIYNAPTL